AGRILREPQVWRPCREEEEVGRKEANMSDAMARLSDLRISARKARLVADLIRGKKVGDARTILQYTVKRTAHPLFKLLNSAAANAEQLARLKGERVDPDNWIVSQITVDEGRTLYRFMS